MTQVVRRLSLTRKFRQQYDFTSDSHNSREECQQCQESKADYLCNDIFSRIFFYIDSAVTKE